MEISQLCIPLSQKTHQGWKEVLITSTPDPIAKTILRPSDVLNPQVSTPPSTTAILGQNSSSLETRFRSVLASELSPVSTLLGSSSPRFVSLPIGTRIEVSAASFQTAHRLGTLISQGAGGCALVVDYGADHAFGNSFRVHLRPLLAFFISVYFAFLRRLSRAMRSQIPLISLARQILPQTSTLHTSPRRSREMVSSISLLSTQGLTGMV
jgi:Putative S-adenosyl-L-methionine-dependent methyltransferase